jgi:hypothetical protein
MASCPNVLPIFPEPDGKISLAAIAQAVRKTKYEERLTNGELAFQLRVDASTIENAEAERNLLKFDASSGNSSRSIMRGLLSASPKPIA